MQRGRSPFLKSPLPLRHQEKATRQLERQQIKRKMKTQGIDVSSSLHPKKKNAQHYKPLIESTHFYFHHSHYAFPEEQEYEKRLGSTFESIVHGLITETEAGVRLTRSVLPRWRISLIVFRPPKLMLS